MANMMIPEIPGQYWGFRRILARIGYPRANYKLFLKLIDEYALPVYKLPRGHQSVYVATEALLQLWEISRIKATRQHLRERIHAPGHWYRERRGG